MMLDGKEKDEAWDALNRGEALRTVTKLQMESLGVANVQRRGVVGRPRLQRAKRGTSRSWGPHRTIKPPFVTEIYVTLCSQSLHARERCCFTRALIITLSFGKFSRIGPLPSENGPRCVKENHISHKTS